MLVLNIFFKKGMEEKQEMGRKLIFLSRLLRSEYLIFWNGLIIFKRETPISLNSNETISNVIMPTVFKNNGSTFFFRLASSIYVGYARLD